MKDQIEILTEERNNAENPARLISTPRSAPVQERLDALLDSVSKESESIMGPGEYKATASIETIINWGMYTAVIAVTLLLTCLAGRDLLRYLSGH